MKTKPIKTLLIIVSLLFSLAFSIKIIKNKCSDLSGEFHKSAKGKTLHFVNSFIN